MATEADTPQVTLPTRMTADDLMSSLPARSVDRDVRVGLFVLLGLVAFFAALFTLTDVGTFRGRYYLTTVVPDAGGMRTGDPVQMRGVNVGRVTEFQMVPEGVAVRLELYNRYQVPEGSSVVLKSSGLLGGMVVEIVPGSSQEALDGGETLPGRAEPDLMADVAGLGTRADTVLTRVNALLSPETIGAVGESGTELQALLAELNELAAHQRVELAALSGSLRRSAEGIEGAATGGELERSLAQIDSLTGRLNQASASLGRASSSLETVLTRLERGEGTLGKLSLDEELYVNLNEAAANLNALVADIRENPRRYLNVSVF